MDATVTPRLLTIPQVVEYTGISKTTLYRMIDQDKLPGVLRIGGMIRVDKQALDQWIDKQRAA